MSQQEVVLLGSTGSIGTQTLDVLNRLHGSAHERHVVGLSAGRNVDRLAEQIERWRPRAVAIARQEDSGCLSERFPDLEVFSGPSAPQQLVDRCRASTVVNALVGAVGLPPTLAALKQGATVALANKESLVIGGHLVQQALAEHGGQLLPIDSEHNAVLQCLEAGRPEDIARIILTASGGPFRRTDPRDLAEVTPEQALKHPNWSMGRRITIDSATMVNKAFEVIEAHYLFALPYDRIDVVIHSSSTVHSFVEYGDGSILAEMATSDMRIPIQYALTYPHRMATDLPRLPMGSAFSLDFEPLRPSRYPAFDVVLEAAMKGGSAPAAMNAADETLIERFLQREIPFTGIARGLRILLDQWEHRFAGEALPDLAALLGTDRWARETSRKLQL